MPAEMGAAAAWTGRRKPTQCGPAALAIAAVSRISRYLRALRRGECGALSVVAIARADVGKKRRDDLTARQDTFLLYPETGAAVGNAVCVRPLGCDEIRRQRGRDAVCSKPTEHEAMRREDGSVSRKATHSAGW